jgi:hypothetical protein
MAAAAGSATSSLGPRFLQAVESFKGVPYVWGGTTRAGVDCSGLVWAAAKQVGVNVPRTTTTQWAALPHISASQVQPGDLVYFTGADPPSPGHVGVVDGTGRTWSMIDAPQTGMDVQQQSFSVPGAGEMRVVGFARLPGAGQTETTGATQMGGGGGGLFSLFLPKDALQFFDDATQFVHSAMWILNPENWMRLIAGAAAVILLVLGVGALTRAA